jgi:NAD(P)-dependent dehydrogenase (short-subunit alcohol dehydrogenase family)
LIKQRVVFVTGGNGGIGTVIIRRLLEEKYSVVYTYHEHERDPEHLAERFPNIRIYHCDLLDRDEVDSLAISVLDEFKTVDILINCAGIMLDSPFLRMAREDWDLVIDTNLKSIFSFARAFLPGMLRQKYGRIINISSVTGLRGYPGKTNYSASKAGIIGFTRSLAVEVASKGVTVNAVTPGLIDTRMIKAIPPKKIASILNSIPEGRIGKPEEVAGLVAFLASEDSSYITGEAISISGGY